MHNPIDFSKRSRRAVLIFTATMLVLVLLPRMYYLFAAPQKFTFSQTPFQKQQYKGYEFKKHEKRVYDRKKSKFSIPSAKFDPNTYSASDWMILGMSQKQAEIIVKFGKHGFYSDEDLKKVFVISDKFFDVIKDSLFYPAKPAYEKFERKSYEPKAIAKVEINTASEEELMTVRGIGGFFAKNIVKRRNELGGFRDAAQLLEVWKFDQEKLDGIAPFITIDASLVKQINVNTATAEELKTHPYISWNVANSIVKMRTQIGSYKKLEDLKKSVLVTEELFEKLKPYLVVE